MFWLAIKTGLITYAESKDMYMEEIERVIQADIYLKKLEKEIYEKNKA